VAADDGVGLLRDRDDDATAPEYDIARFGSEVFRASPRQADLMIVSGRVAGRWARSSSASTIKWPIRSG